MPGGLPGRGDTNEEPEGKELSIEGVMSRPLGTYEQRWEASGPGVQLGAQVPGRGSCLPCALTEGPEGLVHMPQLFGMPSSSHWAAELSQSMSTLYNKHGLAEHKGHLLSPLGRRLPAPDAVAEASRCPCTAREAGLRRDKPPPVGQGVGVCL